MRFIINLVVTSIAVILSARLLPGVHIQGMEVALFVALALWLLNLVVKPLLILFTLPFTIATFGLFLIIINTVIILVADQLVHRFSIDSFGWALLFSIVLALIRGLLESLTGSRGPRRYEE